MSSVVELASDRLLAIKQQLEREQEWEFCHEHPAYLLQHVEAIDAKTGKRFCFEMFDTESGWYFQRELLDSWLTNSRNLVLKARQLGITWLACGLALWYLLFRPGTRVLLYSIGEEEAKIALQRIWTLYNSLPEHFKRHVTLVSPAKETVEPSEQIKVRHADGRISTIRSLPSTKKAGRSETATLVILDEMAFQDYAKEIWTSTNPVVAGGGRVIGVTTANGVSNKETGQGNFFHHAWSHAEEYRIDAHFLGVFAHPDRDQAWYDEHAMALPKKERRQEYPRDEHEAFILAGLLFFDEEALEWYRERLPEKPLFRGLFREVSWGVARFAVKDEGPLRVYEAPRENGRYAIGADASTGHGLDFSAFYVIDLDTPRIVAEYHGKVDPDQLATQLHFVGKWYNTARICIERTGGYGDAVIITLRDGKMGRPPYPKLYRHRKFSRTKQPLAPEIGFPVNNSTRQQILSQAEKMVRKHDFPFITPGLLSECHTFIHPDEPPLHPDPRAMDGCNDDRVLAFALTTEMFRQYGKHWGQQHKRNEAKKKRKQARDQGRFPGDRATYAWNQ